jgi:hypothetical protein
VSCYIDEGGRCEVWDDEMRTARKVHRCAACDRPINLADAYPDDLWGEE